jgi:hypothetical protein
VSTCQRAQRPPNGGDGGFKYLKKKVMSRREPKLKFDDGFIEILKDEDKPNAQ